MNLRSAPLLKLVCGIASIVTSCGDEPSASSLAERAQTLPTPQTSQNPPTPDPSAPSEPTTPTTARDSTRDPTADLQRPHVALRLALDPSVRYRVDTVAMVELPAMQKPVGYAIAQTVELSACEGDGDARHCTATHRYVAFDAEPPTGRFLQNDHDRVATAVTTQTLHADGTIEGTRIEGSIAEDDRIALQDAHHFWCIRLPGREVAEGETWTDTCRAWARGAVATREVTWTLAKLEDDPDTGKRAELHYQGTYVQTIKEVQRSGTVRGVLYFFSDHGQPHLLRETVALPLGTGGAATKAVLNVQFAAVDPSDPDARLRTDGKPFPRSETPQGSSSSVPVPVPVPEQPEPDGPGSAQ